MLFLLLILLLPLAYATLGEPYRPVFRKHRVGVRPEWPELSIVHISDLHVRRSDLRLLRAQRAALAGLAPDLVCVTGDVCEEVEDIHLLVDLLQQVKPRLGTFIVLGNHEHNAPVPDQLQPRGVRKWLDAALHFLAPRQRSDGDHEAHAMSDALQAAGYTVLHNEGVRVVDGDRSLWIAGSDSSWAGHSDIAAAMTGRREGEPCLALIHEPDVAFDAHEQGADLILAGHTHGGQVRVPFLGAPITHVTDSRINIAAGFQRIGQAVLHITAGLGHTIPLRFGCPPEVAWLEVSGRSSAPPG